MRFERQQEILHFVQVEEAVRQEKAGRPLRSVRLNLFGGLNYLSGFRVMKSASMFRFQSRVSGAQARTVRMASLTSA